MAYNDSTLIAHIEGKLDSSTSAQIDADVVSASLGSDLHDRYWKLQVWQVAKSQKLNARHLCKEHRTGSLEHDADDLVTSLFENLLNDCEKYQVHTLRVGEEECQVLNEHRETVQSNRIRARQCKLQVIELQNVGNSPKSVHIPEVSGELDLAPESKEGLQIKERFLKVRSHDIRLGEGIPDDRPPEIVVYPLKSIARRSITNLAIDQNLNRLTPEAREQADALDQYGKKPRYSSKSDAFESFDSGEQDDDDPPSEERLLSQQKIEEMRRATIDGLEMREQAVLILDYLSSDKINPDWVQALLAHQQGHSYSEIARELGIKAATARTRVCRARIAIAKEFPEIHEQLKAHRKPRSRSGDSDEE